MANLIVLVGLSFIIDEPLLLPMISVLVVGAYLLVCHTKLCFAFLFFLIPLSGELEVPGGLATDLPGEPLLWGLTLVTIVLFLINGFQKSFLHPIAVALSVMMLWMGVCTLTSAYPIVSIKFLVAKSWYILPFFILPIYLLQSQKDIDRIIDFFFVGLLIAAVYYFFQHALLDFDFGSRVNAGKPIWRNHVNYACTVVCSIPMLWYRYRRSGKKRYILLAVIFLVFLYFAFARVSYLCLIAAVGFAVLLKWRIATFTAIAGFVIAILLCVHIVRSDEYLRFAPQYGRAIAQGNFESKVENTFSGQDISTMERVHRWVAGTNMIQERPLTGFGPSTFYNVYKPYTRYSFETYVSDNPERSGIHSYYLMTLVEQGWVGLFLLLGLIVVVIRKIETLFHSTTTKEFRQLLFMTGMIVAMILTLNTINDMLEVIKIGSLFFFGMFIVVWIEKQLLSKKH